MRTNIVVVLHEGHKFGCFLIDVLSRSGITSVDLTGGRAHNRCVRSYNCAYARQCSIEVSPGYFIQVQDISGVVLLDRSVLLGEKNKENDDRFFYKKSGWMAFWLHALHQAPVAINKIHHQMMSPSYFSLPRLYRIMSSHGLRTPVCRFDSRGIEPLDGRIFMRSLGCYSDFSGADRERLFCIEKKSGVWIRMLYYCSNVEAVLVQTNKSLTVPIKMKNKIINLCQELTFDLAEILCASHENKWVVYGITAWPNWPFWKKSWEDVAQAIMKPMLSSLPKSNGAGTSNVMAPLVLPYYQKCKG